jgi:FkbM family methyltransferase
MVTLAPDFSKRLSLERVRALGACPRTVIDVGVATGTPEIYGVFEGVRYLLIEPLAESAPFMQKVVDQHPGSVAVQAAAGRAAGEGQLTVAANLSGSSFTLNAKIGQARVVPIVTIDDMVARHGFEPPHILKLDVQGWELEALAGAEQTVRDSLLVIAEVSLWADRKKKGMAELHDMMAWFHQRGLALYDIAQLARRDDGAITEMDLVFCPADSFLRQNASYKSAQQAEAAIAKRRKAFGME